GGEGDGVGLQHQQTVGEAHHGGVSTDARADHHRRVRLDRREQRRQELRRELPRRQRFRHARSCLTHSSGITSPKEIPISRAVRTAEWSTGTCRGPRLGSERGTETTEYGRCPARSPLTPTMYPSAPSAIRSTAAAPS